MEVRCVPTEISRVSEKAREREREKARINACARGCLTYRPFSGGGAAEYCAERGRV